MGGGSRAAIHRPSISHTCFIGFKSGEYARSIHKGDILRLKAFVYNVCMNDIPIDVACHRYTLNMHVTSGTKNISSPNEPSCATVTVSFKGVLLVVTGTWRSPY
ncbi:uncharacterized protein TNCV_1672831 [Trichonephila clavipes]|nr:uncharacterized protein TNCV_1672831 [Trichonephila clavipes]